MLVHDDSTGAYRNYLMPGLASKNVQFLFMIIAYSCKIRGQKICISTLGIALVGPGLQAPMDDGY